MVCLLQVAHETSVKAQVKLSFKDVSGKSVVVTRNIEATQKVGINKRGNWKQWPVFSKAE